MMRRRLFLVVLGLFLLGSALASSGDRRCYLCGALITDQDNYYQVKGGKEVYCERCYLEAPRCSLCKLPTAAENIDPTTGACPKCLAKLPRCKACGKPIIGTFYKFPSTKDVFCADCKNNRPACVICGVPVGNNYWKYPDGRIICNECGGRAIFDAGTIRNIVRNAQEIAGRRLGLKVKRPYTVTVEKLSGLASSGSDQAGKTVSADGALYGRELGMYRSDNSKSEIFLLFGLPPELLYEAAAHEFAHAWQAENGLSDLEPELLEGFAQWVAAEVLREKGYRSALEKLEARKDFPYGTGYQRLKSLHQRIVMDLIRQKR